MQDIIFSALSQILLVLVTILAGYLVRLIVAKVGLDKINKAAAELAANQTLAVMAVRYAQQCYWAQKGYTRYAKAADWLAGELMSRGVKVTSDQIKILIESALRELKDEFGEEWAKAIKAEVTS